MDYRLETSLMHSHYPLTESILPWFSLWKKGMNPVVFFSFFGKSSS
jgi:hypothetical protein